VAMKITLFCLLAFTLMAREHGFAQFDYGSGVVPNSPSTSLNLNAQSPLLSFEISATNFYSFSPIEYDQRLLKSDWAALWGVGIHRWSARFGYFDQFSLIHEYTPHISYGITLKEFLSLSAECGATTLAVEFEKDTEFDFNFGAGFLIEKVVFGVNYRTSHISADNSRSIPLGELILTAVASENRLGSQGVRFFWNHTDKLGYLTLSQHFSITNWLNLGISMRSEPFQLGLSFSLKLRAIKSGFLFSRHSVLGWSHTGAIQFQPRGKSK
jgi:hypothetical protein